MRSRLPPAHLLFALASCVVVSVSTPTVAAQSAAARGIPFPHPDLTVHWFRAVATPGGIDWEAANRAAARAGGYLATIQSEEENDLVSGMLDDPIFWKLDRGAWVGPWVGGIQQPNSKEPMGGWGWANLDEFLDARWTPGQPDNAAGADRIHYGGSSAGRASTWADGESGDKLPGYVIEFSGANVPVTLGLRLDDARRADGYTLLNPWFSKTAYLIDERGRVVHTWNTQYRPGMVDYFLESGHLLRAGLLQNTAFNSPGGGGVVQEIDWDGNPVWKFEYSTNLHRLHHDIERLPNGNVLAIAWEMITAQQAIAAGRDPAQLPDGELWPDKIIEIEPDGQGGGKIVWEWRGWDHLVQDFDSQKPNYAPVMNRPERIDVNYEGDGNPRADWMHSNAVAYNAKLDQIMISARDFNEVWVIDHSTTTAEAAGSTGGRSGKGGDLLYRWGNPAAYQRGTAQDQQLFLHHDTHWIADNRPGAGNMLVFNNGGGRVPPYSTVDEVALPTPDAQGNYSMSGNVWGPNAPTWTYEDPLRTTFYAPFVSSAERLKNGNTLICAGSSGRVFEVTSSGETVWDYNLAVNPRGIQSQGETPLGNIMFRARRYAPDFPGFANRALQAGEPIENYHAGLLLDGARVPSRVRVGNSATLSFQTDPDNQGKFYQFGTSATAGLIPVDSRFIPLAVDPLLISSSRNTLPSVFTGYSGVIDAQGRAAATIATPATPGLVGLRLHTVVVVVDKYSPSRVREVSNVVVLQIEP